LPSGQIEEPIGQNRFLPAPIPGSNVLPFVPPVIKKEPDSLVCNEGESATFEIWVESASTLIYQWKVNDVVLQEGAKGLSPFPTCPLLWTELKFGVLLEILKGLVPAFQQRFP
jgi:hypothetical protein